MKKKILVILLAFCTVLTFMPVSSFAQEEEPVQNEQPEITADEELEEVPIQTKSETEENLEQADGGVLPEEAGVQSEPEEVADTENEDVDDGEELPGMQLQAPPPDGTVCSYTSSGKPLVFKITYGGKTYKGGCANIGVTNKASGKATMDSYAVNSTAKIVKMIYYYGYKKKWYTDNAGKKATTVLGFTDSSCKETAKHCITALLQRHKSGSDAKFLAKYKVNGYRMYTSEKFMKEICKLYNKFDASSVKYASNHKFEMSYGKTESGYQNFYVWRLTTTTTTTKYGYLKLIKSTSRPEITDYSEQETGDDDEFGDDEGGDDTGTTADDDDDEEGDDEFDDYNPYHLAGAQYQVYTDSACTTKAKTSAGANALLTTKETGDTNKLKFEVGEKGTTFYVKEIKASPGFNLDTKVYTVKVTPDDTSTEPVEIESPEPPIVGKPNFKIHKKDAEGDANYTGLIGAQFKIKYYEVSDRADISDDTLIKTWTFQTRKMDGNWAGFDWQTDTPVAGNSFFMDGSSRVLPLGWITIQETKAPNGYDISNDIYYGHIYQSGTSAAFKLYKMSGGSLQEVSGGEAVFVDEIQPGRLNLKKSEPAPHYSHPENYSLIGAEYTVYTNSSCTTQARDANGNLAVLITQDENGNSNTLEMDPGTYWIKETKASPGHLLDNNIYSATITAGAGGSATIQSTDGSVPSYVALKKTAKSGTTNFLTDVPNNYEIAGAEFEVYTDAACTKQAKDVNGNVIKFVTDKNGNAPTYTVDIGDYWAKEVKAPKGYKLPTKTTDLIHIVTADESNTANSPAMFEFTDEPTYGEPDIKIYKYSTKDIKDPSRLTGAYYQISYYDIKCDYGDKTNPDPKNITYGKPTRKWIFKTRLFESGDSTVAQVGFDWQTDDAVASLTIDAPVSTAGGVTYKKGDTVTSDAFYMEDGKRILPIGFYTIEEIAAPDGFAINSTVVHGKIYQSAAGTKAQDYKDNDIIRVDYEEAAQAVTIAIQKVDAETGKNQPQGGNTNMPEMIFTAEDERLASFGSLAGATYNVYFSAEGNGIPEIVGQIITDESGYGELTKRTLGRANSLGQDLEPGTYYIEEVKASPGYAIDKYVLNGTNTVEVPSGAIEVICDYDEAGNAITKKIGGRFENGALTGAVEFNNDTPTSGSIDSRHVFKAEIQAKNIYMFTYTATSREMPHTTEITKTDVTTTKELPGATLQVINSDGEIVTSWVSTTEPHMIKALPSGTYTLREITAPYGYDVAEDVQFTITDNVIYNKVEMQNKPLKVETHAVDTATNTHQGTFAADETITDKVKVSGLYVGRTYKISGVLMDKETGDAVKGSNGNTVTAESEPFVATADEMEIPVVFTVDSASFNEKSAVVVFEKLFRTERIEGRNETNDFPDETFPVELAKHEDLDDEEQTVSYGRIVATIATDAASKSHNILADKDVTIVDIVEYKGLSTANEYLIKGELYDKTSGQLLGVTSERKFTPKTSDGTIEIEFKFDASKLKNHDLVAFEELYINGILINKHDNPNDEEQTVHVPEIFTTAVDSETMAHLAYGDDKITVMDKVEYRNLIPGQEYTMTGVLMNKETNQPVVSGGKEVTASAKFTPEAKDGSVDITFEFDGTELRGSSVVAFEECSINDVAVAVHENIEDEDQTVHIPKIWTTAVDSETNAHVTLGDDKITVIDKVEYRNLIPKLEYTMSGVLMNKETGEPLLSDGKEVRATAKFTPEEKDGSIDITFEFNGADLKGSSAVAFEECFFNDVIIASHADIEDEEQTVHVPEIYTTAVDSESMEHLSQGDDKVTIIDKVEYRNLVPGLEYTMSGTLMNKETGEPVLVDEKEVKASTTFTPEEKDGSVDVIFEFNGTSLKNSSVVAFEECTFNGVVIAVHADIEDADQTVNIPEIWTTAVDAETMAHLAYGGEKVTVIDVVEYRNLIPGLEYTMTGTLMDKESGEPAMVDGEEIKASTTFTPAEKDGSVEVIFEFDGTELTGTSVVAFEECTINGAVIAVHADIEDEAQTVAIPEIGTTAALVKKNVEDTVEYTNLQPGKYVMRGWLVDHKTGKKLIDSDGETAFEIDESHASGEVVVDLPIKGYNKLGGYSLTAFEELYYVAELTDDNGNVTEEVLVADHTDRNDEAQTIKIPGVKTGDNNKLYLFIEMFTLLVLASSVLFFKRRKRN